MRGSATSLRLALAVAAATCAAAGCAASPDARIDAAAGAVAAPGTPRDSVRAILLGPVTCAPGAVPGEPLDATVEEGNDRPAAPLLRSTLRDALLATGRFDDVRFVEDEEGLAPSARDHAIRVDARLERASIRPLPSEGSSLALAVVLWSFTGIFSGFVEEKRYELALEPVFTLAAPGLPTSVARVAPGPARTADSLSFFDRRSGAGAYVATFFGAPPFAFDAMPGDVTTSLAAGAWREPAQSLATALGRLRRRARIGAPRAVPGVPVSARLLAPKPDALVDRASANVLVRIAVRPDTRKRLKVVFVAGRRFAASGVRFDTPVLVPLDGGALLVEVGLDDDPPAPVLEIAVRPEWVEVGPEEGSR